MPSDLEPIGWRAWYTDRRVFQSTDPNDWASLPETGVLLAAIYFRRGSRVVSANRGGDTLYWLKRFSGGRWTLCCDMVADARTGGAGDRGEVKEGEWAPDDDVGWAQGECLRLREDPPNGS